MICMFESTKIHHPKNVQKPTYFCNFPKFLKSLLLPKVRFLKWYPIHRPGELEGCVEMFEHFHNSTISLSKVVRQQYQVSIRYGQNVKDVIAWYNLPRETLHFISFWIIYYLHFTLGLWILLFTEAESFCIFTSLTVRYQQRQIKVIVVPRHFLPLAGQKFWSWKNENIQSFDGFGQAKFAHGGLILGSSQFTPLPQLLLKTMLGIKGVKINKLTQK